MEKRSNNTSADLGPPLLIGPKDACKLLGGISTRTLWALASRGAIPSVRIGHKRMYSPDQLRQHVAACGKASANEPALT